MHLHRATELRVTDVELFQPPEEQMCRPLSQPAQR